MIVTLQRATLLTGKSRSTLERHIKQGKLSRTNEGIDTSELLRVYGAFVNEGDVSHDASNDAALTQREQWLMRHIEELKREHQERERQYLEREQRLMLLLSHYQPDTPPNTSKETTSKENKLFNKLFKRR